MIAQFVALATFIGVGVSGCAGVPIIQQATQKPEPTAERVILVNAAKDVQKTPWPTPKKVSMLSRLAGGDAERGVTSTQAIKIYTAGLKPAGAKFDAMLVDANENLTAAAHLLSCADGAMNAPRLSMNDVAVLEDAIQALRENRRMYVKAADILEDEGEGVDETLLADMRDTYRSRIKDLGKAADLIADRVSENRQNNLARPAKPAINPFSDI